MVKCITLEVRDSATHIPVLAISTQSEDYLEQYNINRAGYSQRFPQIIVMRLAGCEAHSDPREWKGSVLQTAHYYIVRHFKTLNSGDVIDIQFILGETKVKKTSERIIDLMED